MRRLQKYAPVVLILEKQCPVDAQAVRDWCESSGFQACETDNIFEALEEMSDFTTRDRPDVILLDVESCDSEFPAIRNIFDSQGENVSIYSFGSSGIAADNDRHIDTGAVALRLESMIGDNCRV
jgi:hypothetical protein